MPRGSDIGGSIRPRDGRLLRWLACLGVTLASLGSPTPPALAAECGQWTLVDGTSDIVPAYADTHAQYWVWSFIRTRRSLTTAFRFQGQFPYARYLSFQTYSASQADALQDVEIVPDAGNVNPFQPGVDRDAVMRAYTVWFVPPTSAREQNSVRMPSDTATPDLVLRLFRADQGQPDGGVPLPTVEAFDDRTGLPAACPARGPSIGLFQDPREVVQLPSPEDPVHFYRVTGMGVIPNDATGYVAARLADPEAGTLVVLRFALPSFPDTYHQPGTPLTGREDVRYLGLCVHGRMSTLTSECLCDDELRPGQDSQGLVTVVVGPEDGTVRAAAEARGALYLSWQAVEDPLLLYRQILPHAAFAGSVLRVPVYDPDVAPEAQQADAFMGVYAPTGVVCEVSTFLADASQCGPP